MPLSDIVDISTEDERVIRLVSRTQQRVLTRADLRLENRSLVLSGDWLSLLDSKAPDGRSRTRDVSILKL